MAEGRSNQAIAERMFVTLRAVEKHVTSIFTKLGLRRAPTITAACSPCSPSCGLGRRKRIRRRRPSRPRRTAERNDPPRPETFGVLRIDGTPSGRRRTVAPPMTTFDETLSEAEARRLEGRWDDALSLLDGALETARGLGTSSTAGC